MSGVTVICPNSRRCHVKVTPSTHLRKVLEEACLKQGFDVDCYELKHHNRTLDAALPFRLSGLPNNATIEMTRILNSGAPTNVEIAIQISDGTRKLQTLSNEMSLLDVLRVFSKEFGFDLVKCGDERTIPICAYMNKEYRGEGQLSLTTLKSIGISTGRSLIRYSTANMSDEELHELAKQLSEEKERKEKLSEGFDKRKADNVRREEIERQREEQFERERREAEEAAAAAAARELAQLEQTAISHTQRHTTSDSSVTGSGEELGSSGGVTVPTDHTTDGQIAQTNNNNNNNNNNNSRSIFDNNESRLQRLQSILSQVNSSLSSASEDFLAERLLTENGRIDMNADLHTASAAAAAAAADTVAPAQAPPLPLPLPPQRSTPAALHHQQQPSDHSSSHIESLTSQISTLQPSERAAATTQPSSTVSRISTAAKCDRNAMLIPRVILQELSQHQPPASLANVDDQFFELSVHDAQTLQRDLREQVRAHQQRALLPRQYIEQRNRELKEDAYKHTVIRFQLPDKTTIQAFFLSKEPVSNVYEFIRSILRDSTKRFDLYFVLNQKITNDKAKHLIDADLAPASTIFLRFYGKIGDEDDYASLFSEKALKYVSLDEADSATKQWLSANSVYQRYDPRVSEESRLAQNVAKRQAEMASDHYESQLSSSTHQQQSSSSSSSHSVSAPKWFKKM